MTAPVLQFKPEETQSMVNEVMERSGQNLMACYQCRRCAAGCPVGEETGFVTPDRLIRMILLGDREKALSNELVWKCVSCYTCGTRCPNEIQTARITETLKQMSKEEHIAPLAPKVADFHNAFCTSTKHFGRLNEIEFMGLYETKVNLRDLSRFNFKAVYDESINSAKLGLVMTMKGRMHFWFEKVKNLSEIRRLFKRAKKRKQAADKGLQDQG
ncbi:MAG: 4Fe-4S dicluster domain-containing protein [Proteobacteria bacterium]|nr:4Fe-4S dicluster domain-containing protein [Pseudomonadota bacterium]